VENDGLQQRLASRAGPGTKLVKAEAPDVEDLGGATVWVRRRPRPHSRPRGLTVLCTS
jgi:hypothetical protein